MNHSDGFLHQLYKITVPVHRSSRDSSRDNNEDKPQPTSPALSDSTVTAPGARDSGVFESADQPDLWEEGIATARQSRTDVELQQLEPLDSSQLHKLEIQVDQILQRARHELVSTLIWTIWARAQSAPSSGISPNLPQACMHDPAGK